MGCVSCLSVTRLVVKAITLAAALFWVIYWILVPIPKGNAWLKKINLAVTSEFLGTKGSLYLLQAMPIVAIAFAGLFGQLITEALQKRVRERGVSPSARKPSLSLWTLPAFVRSPIGMLTFGELVLISILLFTVLWYFGKNCQESFLQTDQQPLKKQYPGRWAVRLDNAGVYLGKTAQIPLALLWIPVSRGSPVLRVIGLSFERAVKYHIWLGQLCIILLFGHGVTLVFAYHYTHQISSLVEWQTRGVALLPGIIALSSGVIMFVTALPYIRRNHFDTFLTAHHLYIVFFAFFLFHAVNQAFFVVIPVLLFFVDCFIRFVQSRKTVDLLSVKVLSSSALELKFKKPSGLICNPLGFVYLKVPSVSRLQWHPFSLTSSPLDQKDEITICIKPLGGFTKELHREVHTRLTKSDALNGTELPEYKNSISLQPHSDQKRGTCPFSLKVAIEGPYGDTSSYYLKYSSLILVAGGIGITPFISLLRDLLHRYKYSPTGLPSTIRLIITVRNANELCILNALDPALILDDAIDNLSIQVHAYITSTVTSISAQDKENTMSYADFCATYVNVVPVESPKPSGKSVEKMSSVAGSGNTVWVGTTVFASLLGFTIVWGLFNLYALGSMSPNYKSALLLLASMAIGVVGFGGAVLLLWAKHSCCFGSGGKNLTTQAISANLRDNKSDNGFPKANSLNDIERVPRNFVEPSWMGSVTIGRRPNWRVKLGEFEKQMGGQNVGALVSGPPGMREDVAKECQHQAIRYMQRKSDVVFHFHSLSFEL